VTAPVIERLTGTTNGANRTFETSTDYKPGTVRVFRNGMLNEKSLVDGWVELGGKRIRVHEPPKTTDIMQAYYIPIS
jgi:hypothetical protein